MASPKVYRTAFKLRSRRFNEPVTFEILADANDGLSCDWRAVATELISTVDLFADTARQRPTRIHFYIGNTDPAIFNQAAPKHALTGLSEPTETQEVQPTNLFEIVKPRVRRDDLILPSHVSAELNDAMFFCMNKTRLDAHLLPPHLRDNSEGVFMNFWGDSGTGKTMAAEVVAGALGRDLWILNSANLESEFVSRTSKHIHKVFREAAEVQCVLQLDEADSFLSTRISNPHQSADHSLNASRTQLLKELETFPGVVVFTTNHMSSYDIAFQRRILYNIEFPLPDARLRRLIFDRHAFSELIDPDLDRDGLAVEMEGFAGGDIKNVVRHAMVRGLQAIDRGDRCHVITEDFRSAVRRVQLTKRAYQEPKRIAVTNVRELPEALRTQFPPS